MNYEEGSRLTYTVKYAIFLHRMNKIDSIDAQLVKLLAKDARQSSNTLAKQLNTSSATVRRRLKKLISNDLLRIIGVVDPSGFGFPTAAVISLNVSHDKLESAVETLTRFVEIRWVSTCTGRFDVIISARFHSTSHLSIFMKNKLAKIEGVRDSETFVCLDQRKGHYIPLIPCSHNNSVETIL